MTQADKQYKILIEDILKNGVSDEGSDVRTVWADGSPAHTVSSFGKQIEFDGSELPILTTKRVAWKTAIKEMLLFWVRQTTQEKDFNEENVSIWAEWFKDGNLGRSYAYQFESHRHHNREIIKVDTITKTKPVTLPPTYNMERLEVNKLCTDELCGNIIDSQNSGKFIVLDIFNNDKEHNYLKMAKVQFLETGYTTVITKENAKKGKAKDLYFRRVCGVGYEGDVSSVKNYAKDEISKLRNRWTSMLKRCYDSSNNRYHRYGGIGVFVDSEWHSFENYLRDIRSLPQFSLAREKSFSGYNLDKDYYNSNCYSKETCVWLSVKDNITYTRKPIILISDSGKEELFLNISDAEKKYSLHNLSSILADKVGHKTSKGYTAKYVDDGNTYRYELSRNQVNELLYNIKNNPQSRRLMTSFWNFADVDKKQLQECAWATNWNVSNGKLDLILIQRSVDTVLGQPFNWFQYSVLQHMIAHVSGLEVGKFIHQTGNVHVYTRHIEDIAKQIEREQFEAPQLWINPEVKNFYDFTIEDFKLIGYKHGEKIPYEVAI